MAYLALTPLWGESKAVPFVDPTELCGAGPGLSLPLLQGLGIVKDDIKAAAGI